MSEDERERITLSSLEVRVKIEFLFTISTEKIVASDFLKVRSSTEMESRMLLVPVSKLRFKLMPEEGAKREIEVALVMMIVMTKTRMVEREKRAFILYFTFFLLSAGGRARVCVYVSGGVRC